MNALCSQTARMGAGALRPAVRSVRYLHDLPTNSVKAHRHAAHPHPDHRQLRCLPRDRSPGKPARIPITRAYQRRPPAETQQCGRMSPGHMSTRRDCAPESTRTRASSAPAHQRRLPGHSPRGRELRELSHVHMTDQVPYPRPANPGHPAPAATPRTQAAAHPKTIRDPTTPP